MGISVQNPFDLAILNFGVHCPFNSPKPRHFWCTGIPNIWECVATEEYHYWTQILWQAVDALEVPVFDLVYFSLFCYPTLRSISEWTLFQLCSLRRRIHCHNIMAIGRIGSRVQLASNNHYGTSSEFIWKELKTANWQAFSHCYFGGIVSCRQLFLQLAVMWNYMKPKVTPWSCLFCTRKVSYRLDHKPLWQTPAQDLSV